MLFVCELHPSMFISFLFFSSFSCSFFGSTHAAAGGDRDLDGVPPRLAHVLEVQRLVGGLVVAALDGERRGVDADLHRRRPVGVHLPVFVVVAFELQLQV